MRTTHSMLLLLLRLRELFLFFFFGKHLARWPFQPIYLRGTATGCGVCHSCIKCPTNSTLLASILRINIGLARNHYKKYKACELWVNASVLTDSITQCCRPLNHQFVHLFRAQCSVFHTSTLSLSANQRRLHQLSHFSFDLSLVSAKSPSLSDSCTPSSISQSRGAKVGNPTQYHTAVHFIKDKGDLGLERRDGHLFVCSPIIPSLTY